MTISAPSTLSEAKITETLLASAAAARPVTLERFRTQLVVDNKDHGGFDPVTEADREAENAIRRIIGERHPDHGIVGEEWDAKAGTSPYCWVIDPIDGTRAFISGVPVWGTLIGLTHEGRAVAGLMEQPFTGEYWLAAGGKLQHGRNGIPAPATASMVTKLELARTSTTSPDMFEGREHAAWTALKDRVQVVRYGLDCYAYCLLATGQIDLVVEVGLKDVDITPLIPIIEAAGGVITTWDGGRAEMGGNCVAAATPELHEQALAVLGTAMAG